MTPEERRAWLMRPILIETVYRGKEWGGVQVVSDLSLRHPEDHPLYDGLESVSYDGFYDTATALELEDAAAFLDEDEYETMHRIVETGI